MWVQLWISNIQHSLPMTPRNLGTTYTTVVYTAWSQLARAKLTRLGAAICPNTHYYICIYMHIYIYKYINIYMNGRNDALTSHSWSHANKTHTHTHAHSKLAMNTHNAASNNNTSTLMLHTLIHTRILYTHIQHTHTREYRARDL